ncbi:hypothetical protein VJ918_11085 [Adlercreutzia sp. R21]|uniref:hypothetical protein n=1 Tax=Adlercreutzia wanghongyangiae TaxID=3111451 RepID=UPI002DB62C88|nr:hypothetical protein [Adlercreutzia sp. R21]MEC4185354.1 hypothetical protein [Adlercreutzia sp. R21]
MMESEEDGSSSRRHRGALPGPFREEDVFRKERDGAIDYLGDIRPLIYAVGEFAGCASQDEALPAVMGSGGKALFRRYL